jgi:hypothetical protein
MKTRAQTLGATLIVATVLFAAAAHAQSGAGRAALQRGVELRYRGDDAGALVEFQRAYDASHSPLALAQMGLAEQALGQWVPAEAHLRAALAIHGDNWIDGHREALSSAYAYLLSHIEPARVEPHAALVDATAPVTPPSAEPPVAAPTAPLPEAPAPETHALQIGLGAGAVVFLGLGFAGIAVRESIVANYNRDCRGFGDPSPPIGCAQTTNLNNANGAAALAATGFVAGGALMLFTAVLFVRQSHAERPRRFALHCGGGPGDIGISCGGSL